MKVFYGQSRRLTLLKFTTLALAYGVCGAIMLVVTALFSVVTY
jgi:hypothetical protein